MQQQAEAAEFIHPDETGTEQCWRVTKRETRKACKSLIEFFYPPEPVPQENVRICLLCFESGATKRKCCNQLYCDHCYTKNRACPYCLATTKKEKMTGATFAVASFSEHEECRCCLDPGVKRRCCGAYYCDDCYYKLPQCRGCEAPVGRQQAQIANLRATVLTIILSWVATIFFIAAVVAFAIVFSTSEAKTEVMMSNYKCYGLFKTCTVDICAESQPEVALGVAAIDALSNWRSCTLDSIVKIESKACIFDQQLYDSTQQQMGYDLCMGTFPNGVFVFEDTFEAWTNGTVQSNLMKSAYWDQINAGYSTSFCGVAQHLGGLHALTFSGPESRYAITRDVDVSTGGWLEAEIFIPPVGFDVTNPNCKSSYQGVLHVQYSIDHGVTWVDMALFDAWQWRQATFFYQKFPVPPGSPAATKATRFRFIQLAFEASRDHWALDNVRVLKFLPDDWHTVPQFTSNLQYTESWMQKAQCCFDTDWCETRLTQEEMDDCAHLFPWYNGRRYLLRGMELYVCIVVLVNVMKFLYVCIMEWVIHKRFPFQDEYMDLANMDRIVKYLPPRFRPKKTLESFVSNIHLSARLAAELGAAFKDTEGEGEIKKTEADIAAEKEAERKRLKAEKKKLKQRMKSKKFQGSTLAVTQEVESDDEEEAKHDTLETIKPVGGEEATSEMDKFKRTNVGMLRVPFDTKVDHFWIKFFRNLVLFNFGLFTFIKLITTSSYVVHQPVAVFGQLSGDASFTSLGVFFFAMCCDWKEIYYCLKNVVPCRPEWVPYITIDLQEDISALFIGKYSISIKDINEINAFPPSFGFACAAAYIIGCFPFCLFSLVLRDQFLQYTAMRMCAPILGLIMLFRAILGPSFIIKIIFSLFYLFATDPKSRERVGVACLQERTWTTGFFACFSFGLAGAIFCAFVLYSFLTVAFGVALAFGFFYGVFSGCYHSLPIRPWMVLTMVRGGVWMRVKKKQRCPCIYWGSFCSDIHDAEEIFIIYPEDPIKFLNHIKGGLSNGD